MAFGMDSRNDGLGPCGTTLLSRMMLEVRPAATIASRSRHAKASGAATEVAVHSPCPLAAVSQGSAVGGLMGSLRTCRLRRCATVCHLPFPTDAATRYDRDPKRCRLTKVKARSLAQIERRLTMQCMHQALLCGLHSSVALIPVSSSHLEPPHLHTRSLVLLSMPLNSQNVGFELSSNVSKPVCCFVLPHLTPAASLPRGARRVSLPRALYLT
jgi:hypothetical protein